MESCGVYLVRNIIDGKVYVGSSVYVETRWRSHVNLLNAGTHSNRHLQSAWSKYGKDAFEFSIIEICPEGALIIREIVWVQYYDSMNDNKGYNLEYPDRRGHTEETRRRISESRIGNPKCMGHGKSDELKRRLSVLHKGNKYCLGHKDSDETRKRKSESHIGHLKGGHLSKEHRKKLSIAHEGKVASEETRKLLSEKTSAYWERKKKMEGSL
jgi:group I intron endonuclease